MSIPAALTDYPNIVRSGKIKVCREQKQLIELVDKRFYEESLFLTKNVLTHICHIKNTFRLI